MGEETFGDAIHEVGCDGNPEFHFINQDENYIKLVKIDDPKEYVLLDKQSLIAFSNAFRTLALKYTD